MSATPVTVWIDPGCPWAWQGAIWLCGLESSGLIELEWRIFSLELNASEPETPYREACRVHGESMVALTLARREGGDPAFERLFRALGTRLHDAGEPMSAMLVRETAAAAGMAGIVDRAIEDGSLADDVVRAYREARARDVFGVPTLAIDGAKVLYGPIIARAPAGDDALRLWEHTRWLAGRDDFFELKRWPRGVRPGGPGPDGSA